MLQRGTMSSSKPVAPEMPARAAAPGDGAPGSVDPALIKMSNQHTKLGQARSEESAPTKLNEQDNTHAVPVCAPQSMAPYAATCYRPRRAPRTVLGSCSRRIPVTRETALPHPNLCCAGLPALPC